MKELSLIVLLLIARQIYFVSILFFVAHRRNL